MAIIVRTDLKMGCGKVASQTAHAAILLYKASLENSTPHLDSWLRFGQPKIILRVDKNCEKTLTEIFHCAPENNVCKVHDAGKTQVDTGTLTAIGIGPNRTKEINKLICGLKLL